ncbi:MAG: hypothetical protein ABIH65_00795 [Nanoarchaeota archaeon]
MRRWNLLILIFFFLISILFSSTNVESAVFCPNEQIILKLSSETNAHGEVWDGTGSYPVLICYDEIFGTPYAYADYSNLRTCANNKVVGLSTTTNAHAEEPGLTNYATNICYGDLDCRKTTDNCVGDEKLVVSLSADTNAHLANDTSYPIHICCTSAQGPVGDGCEFSVSYWSDSSTGNTITETNRGSLVYMIAEGNAECNGKVVNFYIGETDALFGGNYATRDTDDTQQILFDQKTATFSDGKAIASWSAEWHEDTGGIDNNPEYVFMAELQENPSMSIDNSGELKVNYEEIIDPAYWCQDYETLNTCGDYSQAVAERTVNEKKGSNFCSLPTTTSCFCYWVSDLSNEKCQDGYTEINPEYTPPASGTCFYVQETDDTCEDDGMLSFSWEVTWVWDDDCDPTCQDDPKNQEMKAGCVRGDKTVLCPAQIALSFFSFYNLLAAVLIIVVIYLVMHWKKHPSSRIKRKKKSKKFYLLRIY